MYVLYEDGSINKVEGEMITFIPQDLENSDWREYLAWVALGNTADPYVPPEPE